MKSKYYYEFEVKTKDILLPESTYGKDGKDFNTLIGKEGDENIYLIRRFNNGVDYRLFVNLGLDKAETIVKLDQENRKLKEEIERLKGEANNE